eukprot:scaffold1004_cov269-Pinguiococcus_pyrenoidosus.AAC.4
MEESAHHKLLGEVAHVVRLHVLCKVRRRKIWPVPRKGTGVWMLPVVDQHVEARQGLRVPIHIRRQHGLDQSLADAIGEVLQERVVLLLEQSESGGQVHVLQRALVVVLLGEPKLAGSPIPEDEGTREAGMRHVVHEPGEHEAELHRKGQVRPETAFDDDGVDRPADRCAVEAVVIGHRVVRCVRLPEKIAELLLVDGHL